MIIGVVIKILPSLLNSIVIKKQSKFVYKNSLIPEPLDFWTILIAIQLKKPKLSNTIVIIMVDRIVSEGPLTILRISVMSVQDTIPPISTSAAPMVVGIVSFIPKGLHNIKTIVNVKIISMMMSELSHIYIRRLITLNFRFYWFLFKFLRVLLNYFDFWSYY